MITFEQYLNEFDAIEKMDLEYIDREVDPEREPVFNVFLNTREIVIPDGFKDLAVQWDHNAETVWFALDRYFDGVDLTELSYGVQFTNTIGENGFLPLTLRSTPDLSSFINGELMEGDSETFLVGWKITQDVTRVAGALSFSLRIFNIDRDTNILDYNISTNPVTANIKKGYFITDESNLAEPVADNLSYLVATIQDLYQNNQLKQVDYDLVSNKPKINGVTLQKALYTNKNNATVNNGIYLPISYKDLTDVPEVTVDYNELENKPTLNGVELSGAMTTESLGINIDVDNALLETSTNPVENQVVTAAINGLLARVGDIESEMGNMTFIPVSISSFVNDVNVAEIGDVVNEVKFDWNLTGNPVILTLNDEELDLSSRSLTLTENLAETKTYTLYAEDGKGNSDSAETSVEFTYAVFHGVSTIPAAFDSSFVNTLNKKLQASGADTITVDAGEGQYIYYCLPAVYDTPFFAVNGFTGGFSKVASIEYTNDYGVAIDYDIYQSDYANLGKTNVVIS